VIPEMAGIEGVALAGTEDPGVEAGGAADPVEVGFVVAAVPAAGTGGDEVLEVNKVFCRLWASRACQDLLSAMATPSCSARSKKLI
jgi:hypothetical protein